MANESTTFVLSDKSYAFMKKLVQVIIPATAALYFGLAKIWGLPGAENVVGSCSVVTVFLGVILGVSSKQYDNSNVKYDGTVTLQEKPEGGKLFSLNLDGHPDTIQDKKEMIFKVEVADPPDDVL